MNQHLHIGQDGAADFVGTFLGTFHTIALVTGRSSYAKTGAADFLAPLLAGREIVHLKTRSENPKADEVDSLLLALEGKKIDALIAVGGGTSIDTAKLLNLALSSGRSVRQLLEGVPGTVAPLPCLAIPTTAGTGAEATHFAVAYDGEVKHSIGHEGFSPSHVLLLPELTASLSPYQTACTGFDALAQALESYWAKGATDESKRYAVRALRLLKVLPEAVQSPTAAIRTSMLEGAYWAGRAIEISRTTAAHALSYVLTARYGVPHGHAVAMMFPYVFRLNNRAGFRAPLYRDYEFLGDIPRNRFLDSIGLQDFDSFCKERGITRRADLLREGVNLTRLANNPVPVDEEFWESFTYGC